MLIPLTAMGGLCLAIFFDAFAYEKQGRGLDRTKKPEGFLRLERAALFRYRPLFMGCVGCPCCPPRMDPGPIPPPGRSGLHFCSASVS